MSPLWKLCEAGRLDDVRAALARGEDVNSKDLDGQTGLMFAVENKHNSQLVRLLLEQPTADLNYPDIAGSTALHYAAELDNAEGVRLLLADPRLKTTNHKSKDGNTPVMAAIIEGNVNALRELVAHPSVDLDTRDEEGKSLEEVARWEFPSIIF